MHPALLHVPGRITTSSKASKKGALSRVHDGVGFLLKPWLQELTLLWETRSGTVPAILTVRHCDCTAATFAD
jgi:hypothetical protein